MEISSGVHKNKSKRIKRDKAKDLKVVYISSPMKVKTSASRFRALVQELTGCNSDVSRFMDVNGGPAFDPHRIHDDQGPQSINGHDHTLRVPLRGSHHGESPTSSESFLEPLDDVFSYDQMDQQFSGFMFSSSLFNEPSHQLDVLGSYGAV